MQIYVIDPFKSTTPHFPIVGMISDYNSMIWNVQLYGLGYFEVTVAGTAENVSLLKEGRFLVRENDIRKRNPSDTYPEYMNAMIIRRVALKYDADMGYTLTVSGKSVKDVLSQRIDYNYTGLENNTVQLPGLVEGLLDTNITMPYESTVMRQEEAEGMLDEAQTIANAQQIQYEEAVEAYNAAVDQYGQSSQQAKAAKADMDAAKAVWDSGLEDVKYAQAVLNWMNWYLTFAAKRKIPYISFGTSTLTNPPSVDVPSHGENIGELFAVLCEEYGIGWELRVNETGMTFEFVERTDRSATVVFSPDLDNLKNAEYVRSLETYRNAGEVGGEGDGAQQAVVNIGSAEGIARFEEYMDSGIGRETGMSKADYNKLLRQFGKSEITKLKKKESISGEIDTDGVFKIDQDFFLGDIVTVRLDQGITATTRLIEIIYSDETSGTNVIGTFEEWEVE
jgi:hypothetical protein